MRTKAWGLVGCMMWGLAANTFAQAPLGAVNETPPAVATAADPRVQELAAINVTGAQPGPPLWLVRKGSNELWILGTVSPLPRDMTFASREVADVIGRSQEMILAPSITVDVDAGFFGKLALIPSALKARNNPDGKTLQDVLPPATYARWQRLKARHIGRDGGIEKRRPIVAASELYEEALEEVKLGGKPVIWPVVDPLAKDAGLKRTTPRVKHTIKEPKKMLKDASKASFEDAECFEAMLDAVEHDMPLMRARANAWAIGDIDRLRAMPQANPMTQCWNAYMTGSLGQKAGTHDLWQRMHAGWVDAAESALARNRSTFAMLPMLQLVGGDSMLATLKSKGYEVIEP